MKKPLSFINTRGMAPTVLGAAASVLLVAFVTWAATTISNNVSTGALTASGASTLSGTLNVAGATTLNGSSTFGDTASDVNLFTGTLQASTTALFTSGLTSYGSIDISGGLRHREATSSPTGAVTLTTAQSGTTFYLGATGVDITLPAEATASGVVYRFVVAAAFSTDVRIIANGGVGNAVIQGSLMVNGATVDCDNVGSITFEDGVEDLGDFVELRSNGTNWFIGSSNGQAAISITCVSE